MSSRHTCSICRMTYSPTGARAERDTDVCESCAETYGIPDGRLPQARPPRPCAQCGHRVLVRCILRERGAEGGQYGKEYVVPLGVTIPKKVATKFWSGEPKLDDDGNPVTLDVLDTKSSAGILQAYLCRACGYTELYTTAPEEIPIGREYGTELLEIPDDGPYR